MPSSNKGWIFWLTAPVSGNVSVLSVDDHGMNKESSSDLSTDETLGHQVIKNTGGNNAYLRVLHCSNMDFSMNFLEVHMLFKQYEKIERIWLKLSESKTSLDSCVAFTSSDSAADAHGKLGGHTVNSFTLRTRLFDVRNLKDDSFDYFPEDNSQDFVERKAPMPVWFVATYKDEKENYVKATDTLHRALNGIPSNNIKKYGKNILVKVKNSILSKLLQDYKPPEHSNVASISPHKSFNSVKGVIYSKDLHEFSKNEILKRSPPNVYEVKKLSDTNNAILLTFSIEYVPYYVHIGNHIKMKVRRFRSNSKQCRSCFEYDHISDDCKHEKRLF